MQANINTKSLQLTWMLFLLYRIAVPCFISKILVLVALNGGRTWTVIRACKCLIHSLNITERLVPYLNWITVMVDNFTRISVSVHNTSHPNNALGVPNCVQNEAWKLTVRDLALRLCCSIISPAYKPQNYIQKYKQKQLYRVLDILKGLRDSRF